MEKEYKSYKELNGNSIGKWAAQLDMDKHRELTEEEMNVFFKMNLNEKEVEKDEKGAFAGLLDGWNGVNLIYKRLLIHSFTMSKAAMLCCGYMVTSPGEAVMMTNYMQYRCFIHKITHIDMNALSTRIIPMGWFDQEVLRNYWDKQKYVTETGHLANMLDNPEYGLSISVHHLK